MLSYILRRLLQAIPVLIGLTMVAFLMMHLIPGGPAYALLGRHATPLQVAAFNAKYGLNKPLPVQYVVWLGQVVHGNFGTSFVTTTPVVQVIGQAIPHTLDIVLPSILIADIFAVIVGVIQAQRHDTLTDHTLTSVSFLLWSMPTFWLGIIMIMLFAIDIRLFPSGGIANPLNPNGGFSGYLAHSVLPVTTLVLVTFAQWARYMRSSMMDTLVEDYVRTARAKGLPRRTVVYKHAFRNSLLPLITLFGLSLPLLLSGALVTEVVFNYPGMGLLFFNSALSQDYPTLLALVLITGVLTVIGNLLADVLYALVDPRIQYS